MITKHLFIGLWHFILTQNDVNVPSTSVTVFKRDAQYDTFVIDNHIDVALSMIPLIDKYHLCCSC